MDCCVQCNLVYDRARCVAVQKQPMQYTQRQEKTYFVLGHPGIACLANFKENNFLLETFSSNYRGFLSFIDNLWIF